MRETERKTSVQYAIQTGVERRICTVSSQRGHVQQVMVNRVTVTQL